MTLDEAAALALKVLKQVMEEKLDDNNVQLAQVSCWKRGGPAQGNGGERARARGRAEADTP